MLPFNLTGLTGAEISLVDEAIQRLRLTPEGSFVLNFLENQENNSLIKFSYSSNFQDNPTGYSWLNDILQINVYQLINTRYFDNVENPTFYKFISKGVRVNWGIFPAMEQRGQNKLRV